MRFAHNAPVEAGYGRADAGGGGGGGGGGGAGADRRDVLSMSLAEILPGLRADARGAVYAVVQVHCCRVSWPTPLTFPRLRGARIRVRACMWPNGRV